MSDRIVSEEDREYYRSIIKQEITPISSKVKTIDYTIIDGKYYTVEQTYSRGTTVVKAELYIHVRDNFDDVKSVKIYVS